MSQENLPKDTTPLTPFGYWQESLQAWTDFSQRTTKIMMGQMGKPVAGKTKPLEADADTLASELLRTLSDMNLRHWQNTARFLESFPTWMQAPHNMTGSALVDWFDSFQRKTGTQSAKAPAATKPTNGAALSPPKTLTVPDGKPDDLTRIKGIGPKLSALLNEIGIYHFKQIADWSEPEALWVDDYLSFKGRVTREAWIKQARALSANGTATLH